MKFICVWLPPTKWSEMKLRIRGLELRKRSGKPHAASQYLFTFSFPFSSFMLDRSLCFECRVPRRLPPADALGCSQEYQLGQINFRFWKDCSIVFQSGCPTRAKTIVHKPTMFALRAEMTYLPTLAVEILRDFLGYWQISEEVRPARFFLTPRSNIRFKPLVFRPNKWRH